jgi:hypothetical protein
VKDARVLCGKGVSSVSLHAFQPFQMHVATRGNLPILTSDFIFPNKEGLEILQ